MDTPDYMISPEVQAYNDAVYRMLGSNIMRDSLTILGAGLDQLSDDALSMSEHTESEKSDSESSSESDSSSDSESSSDSSSDEDKEHDSASPRGDDFEIVEDAHDATHPSARKESTSRALDDDFELVQPPVARAVRSIQPPTSSDDFELRVQHRTHKHEKSASAEDSREVDQDDFELVSEATPSRESSEYGASTVNPKVRAQFAFARSTID